MDKKEAIEKVKTMTVETFFSGTLFVKQQEVIAIIEQIGEPTSGCAEEAPRHLRNILARLRGLPEHDREVWLNGIMSEFEQDFGHVKWRDGYEQGKFEGMFGCEKVKIPQFVADIIEEYKDKGAPIIDIFTEKYSNEEYNTWLVNELNAYDRAARAWLDGYDVEQEKRYEVSIKASGQYLARTKLKEIKFMYNGACSHLTRKELEDAGFGWCFSCEGIEVQEVE